METMTMETTQEETNILKNTAEEYDFDPSRFPTEDTPAYKKLIKACEALTENPHLSQDEKNELSTTLMHRAWDDLDEAEQDRITKFAQNITENSI